MKDPLGIMGTETIFVSLGETWLKNLKTWACSKQASHVKPTVCLTRGTEQEEWCMGHTFTTTGDTVLFN